jgi:hypothetical protein
MYNHMKPFLVRILFEYQTSGHLGKAQFDEQYRWLLAKHLSEAWGKAKDLGLGEEMQFENNRSQQVQQVFICVLDVVPLGELQDGEILHSVTHEAENRTEFRSWMQHQAGLSLEFRSPEKLDVA